MLTKEVAEFWLERLRDPISAVQRGVVQELRHTLCMVTTKPSRQSVKTFLSSLTGESSRIGHTDDPIGRFFPQKLCIRHASDPIGVRPSHPLLLPFLRILTFIPGHDRARCCARAK